MSHLCDRIVDQVRQHAQRTAKAYDRAVYSFS
jgi:hypothetical protein